MSIQDINLCDNATSDFKCNCGKQYSNRSGIWKHMKKCKLFDESMDKSYYDCACGKQYLTTSGLWRHKQKVCCSNATSNNITPNPISNDPSLIYELMKQNTEFKAMLMEQNTKIIELLQNNNSTTNIGTVNNVNTANFSLNFFLYEQCKDAVNMSDFIDSLELQLKDLETVGEIGYIDGLTKVFMRGINSMDVYKRPIHCSDLKREVLYVKDQDVWEKEPESRPRMTKAVKSIAHKNIKLLPKWIDENPKCNDIRSKKNDEYLKIVNKSMGGNSMEEEDDKINKVIKNVIKEVVIDKRTGAAAPP